MKIRPCKEISLSRSDNLNDIPIENILKDTEAVTEYLKTRFCKDKIFIMGFSGGTHIALRAAREHPENYYALINMAQAVTDGSERDALMYDFMKRSFEDRGDRASLKKLEESVEKTEAGVIPSFDWDEMLEGDDLLR